MPATTKVSNPASAVPHGKQLERLAAGAFLVYLLAFLAGGIFHYFFPFEIDSNIPLLNQIGAILVVFGPALILWAQSNVRAFRMEVSLDEGTRNFARGPYKYMRNPTYLGLTLLVAGFGFFANAACIAITSILSYFIVRFVFLSKEEKILLEKYGDSYLKYQEEVKRWF